MARKTGARNLTMEQRGLILRMFATGKYTMTEIGDTIGVARSCVGRTIRKYKPELFNLDDKHIEAAEDSLENSLRDFNAFEETTKLAKEYVALAKEHLRDPAATKVYGSIAKDYIKLLTQLRGEYLQRHEVDVETGWSGKEVEVILAEVMEADKEESNQSESS